MAEYAHDAFEFWMLDETDKVLYFGLQDNIADVVSSLEILKQAPFLANNAKYALVHERGKVDAYKFYKRDGANKFVADSFRNCAYKLDDRFRESEFKEHKRK